jgi:hypothetical protein
MTEETGLPQEIPQEALDFLKEQMRLRFPLVEHQHPDLITTRIQRDKVFVDVWSTTGAWVMSSEDSVEKVRELAELIKNPEVRAQMLSFLAELVRKGHR